MRFPITMTAIRTQVAAMVHPSVLPNSVERIRHERFMLTRLALGAVALSLAPTYLAWRGTMGALELLVLIAVTLPLVAVFILSRSGRLELAHCVSAAALALLVVALSGMTGGIASPLLLWLAAIPAEAMFFGSRAYVARASAIAAGALGSVAVLHALGLSAEPAPWVAAAMPLLAAAAILHVAAVAFGFLWRRDDEMREHRASGARAQLLLDHVGDLVTWHDATGAVVFANAASASLTGAEPRELIGRGLLERVHVADRPLFL
ncbi:MAG: PAS domain-containing protein, partial [Ensifer adhaerens]